MLSEAIVKTVPLTAKQKLLLVGVLVPIVFFAVAVIFVFTLLVFILGQPISYLLLIVLVICLLTIMFDTKNSLRDLRSGVAFIEEAELENLTPSRSRRSNCYGIFSQLGSLAMTEAAFSQAIIGQRYRVCYSPASRLVWSLETAP